MVREDEDVGLLRKAKGKAPADAARSPREGPDVFRLDAVGELLKTPAEWKALVHDPRDGPPEVSGYDFRVNWKGMPDEMHRAVLEMLPDEDWNDMGDDEWEVDGNIDVRVFRDLDSQFDDSVRVTLVDGRSIGWIKKEDSENMCVILDSLVEARHKKLRHRPVVCQIEVYIEGTRDEEGEYRWEPFDIHIAEPVSAEQIG